MEREREGEEIVEGRDGGREREGGETNRENHICTQTDCSMSKSPLPHHLKMYVFSPASLSMSLCGAPLPLLHVHT